MSGGDESMSNQFDVTAFPKMFRLQQNFKSNRLSHVRAAVKQQLAKTSAAINVRPGQNVAIAVGSRGITNLSTIVRTVVDWVVDSGAVPFVTPAMGSHGGATTDGQITMLDKLDITPNSVGCSVEGTMETVDASEISIGKEGRKLPLHFDARCAAADHVILINRIKPHTRLVGSIQSGLCKMLMIGLGNHVGAEAYHRAFPTFDYELGKITPDVIPRLIDATPVSLGIAIVEDADEQTSVVEAIPADQFLDREPALLVRAAELMPSLPFNDADLLIVDQIGKHISGTGMDTNVIGRKANDKLSGPDEWPKIRQIYVRSLSEKSGGNAAGIGIAEYCRSSVVRDTDWNSTYVNCLTSEHVTAAAIPMHFESDHEVLSAAASQACRPTAEEIRWMWIPDTLSLNEVICSEAYWSSALQISAKSPDWVLPNTPQPLRFGSRGNLLS